MLHGKNIQRLLKETLGAVSTMGSENEPLYSSILLSGINGSIISYANSDGTPTSYNKSGNNLKMMALLIRDKWNEDEQDANARKTASCYTCELADGSESTHIYTYELEDLHACVAQIPRSDLLLLFVASGKYPYGLEVLKMKSGLKAFSGMYGYKLN
ncbi:LAME_0E02476g1_1 [Lachancea meyersii CBS 8951]|uniref:LAME_0E02476g1_1 n=1 Tax=Lachancea meyersii CBS 8951 TaxID=1266667 RepID=A0A1G4JGE8_9SACH|nr:LAME_0E02476g1_1 [Lachancea meyersii CBS 8951]